ncbi:3-dehydroquinate synthase [Haloferula rosea]|uniref:3-dehydroquinate synthase n=1 Tax=Haloferula rosea TaxID=490093 RepID=A0A934RE93_9BACT|nr:3-dehydroquinate synthase [Haloferula rosea]MBK1826971.1 3-dehydroquinate synthase [Haloferula rosea]
MPTVHVDLADRAYQVMVENGLLVRAGEAIAPLHSGKRAAVISDSNVDPHHGDTLIASLTAAGIESTRHIVPAGESSKCFTQLGKLCSELAAERHDRSSFIVALGGGVIGDLAGFVAASFFRGIPFVQIPTTIVAQVDSSVGGKTGINLPEGKNLVGAFHQPSLVLVDPDTLTTLPPREFHEGFAEAIKHAAIRDAAMIGELAALDPDNRQVPAELIARNIAIKARIVEEDELETLGTRALLNFGHTIGHGIEAAVPYGEMLHGEAISLGLRAALFLSKKLSDLPAAKAQEIEDLLKQYHLPVQLPDAITTETVLDRLARDKKFQSGQIRFVLLRDAGDAFLSKDVTIEHLREAIEYLRS